MTPTTESEIRDVADELGARHEYLHAINRALSHPDEQRLVSGALLLDLAEKVASRKAATPRRRR